METLEEMRARHHAIARYSVVVSQQGRKIVLFTGLQFDLAKSVSDQLADERNSTLPHGRRFGMPLLGIDLDNADECLTPEARARMEFLRSKKGPVFYG